MSSTTIQRRSPVTFDSVPEKTEWRNHWPVAQRYPHEGRGPNLVDLSHCPKWDIQSGRLDQLTPWDQAIPAQPGGCALSGGLLLTRLNATQAGAWLLTGGAEASDLQLAEATDVTDASLLLGLVGQHLPAIMEKMTALDLFKPGLSLPLLVQGPVAHVPCRIVCLPASAEAAGLLISCSRGYAPDMVAALLHAGAEYGLRPAGEEVWSAWLDRIMTE